MTGLFGWLNSLDARYAWLAVGLLLAAAEMAIPGVFLIWMAGAAFVTGLATFLLPFGSAEQVMLFALLAFGSVLAGREWMRRHPVTSDDPKMNDRGARMNGQMVVVTEEIAGGEGRVRHGDSEWLATGPDAVIGTRMRVAGHDGTVLLVEHLH
ncbi:MAG: NfeD family protein [Sphingomonadales bacterium]|nr:NfeD family protein [Sphingomonadales bacterium]